LLAVLTLPHLYHERVVDHYDNPRNVGSFDKNDPSVGTGLVGAAAAVAS
jgi:NifU-like protein involved in Fe-S cluster formation